MTNQINAGSASPVAVTAGEGHVEVWCCGCTVLPPLSFVLFRGPIGEFERGDSFIYGVSQGAMVSSKCRPLKMADVASTEILFE